MTELDRYGPVKCLVIQKGFIFYFSKFDFPPNTVIKYFDSQAKLRAIINAFSSKIVERTFVIPAFLIGCWHATPSEVKDSVTTQDVIDSVTTEEVIDSVTTYGVMG